MKREAKKITVNTYVKGVGRRSKRRTGVIVQSIRLLALENNKLHDAAKAVGISFNGWATRTLQREAEKVLARKKKKVTEE